MSAQAQAQDVPPPAGEAGSFAEDPIGVEDGVQEIIVTARKRDERMIDVPVAINAVSAAEVQRYATTDLTQISTLVPQVIIAKSSGAGSGASFVIRGVGSSQGDTGIEQTVSLNLDGVQLSRGRAVGQSFFDVQQIEVLKGPQALFFGKNSPGGVISVRSRGPTPYLEGHVSTSYEFKTDEKMVEAAISGPISDALGFRVAVRGSDFEGYVRNAAVPQANPLFPGIPTVGTSGNPRQPAGQELLGRVTLGWDDGGPVRSTLRVFGAYRDENALTVSEVIGCTGRPATLGNPDPTGDCELNGVRSVAALPPALTGNFPLTGDGDLYAKNRFVLGSWTNEVELAEDIDLTSVLGVYDYNFKAHDEFTFSSFGGLWTTFVEDYTAVSQEVRLSTSFDSPINLTVGGLYEYNRRRNQTNNLQLNRAVDPATGKRLAGQADIFNRARTYSLFAQALWDLTDTVELAGGVRYTREKKFTSMVNTYVHPSLGIGPARRPEGVPLSSDYDEDNWSPEVTLSWHPVPRSTVYVAYKTGFKSGGFSTPQGGIPGTWDSDTPRFGSEKASGFEVGAKAELFGGDVRTSATAYSYEFSDLQQTSLNAVTFLYSIRNATSARTKGVEFDANWIVNPVLALRGSAAFNDASYGQFATSPCYTGQTVAQGCVGGAQDLTGERLARAPRWNVAGGATAEVPLGSALVITATGDVRYTSGYFMQETQNPSSWQDSFVLADASIRLGDGDERWSLALIGRNLTNEWYGVASVDKPLGGAGEIAVSTGRPREIMVQGTFRF